jgi:hypothetical protein
MEEELMRSARYLVWLVCFFWLVPVAHAELAGQDLKEAKKMVKGPLYMRLDAPCRYGARFGLSVEPMLEVSPTESDVERRLNQPGKLRVESVYWGFSPNDAVSWGSLSVKGDTVQVWMEGLPPNSIELIIDFIQIKNLDDFKKAFDLTFSRVPLQDEHPEWPEEIRRAIAEHRVIVGMTKQQAFCVVGAPMNLQTGEENGVKVETWFPRLDRGTIITGRKIKNTRTGFPALIKFVDGRVSAIEETPRSPDLKP